MPDLAEILAETFAPEEEEHDLWFSDVWAPYDVSAQGRVFLDILQGRVAIATVAKGLEGLRDIVFTVDTTGTPVYSSAVTAIVTGLVDAGFLENYIRVSEGFGFPSLPIEASSAEHARSRIEKSQVVELVGGRTVAPATGEQAVMFFTGMLMDDPAVEAVYWNEAGTRVRVWTVIKDFDREIEDRIFAAEGSTLDAFQAVRLDFGVIYRRARSLDEIRPPGVRQVK